MLERELRRYAAYFRGWCQAFGEHESIYREEEIGIHWLAAESQVGLVLPKPLIKAIYREVLLHEQAPTLTFNDEGVQIGSLEIGLEKKFRKKALPAIERILESGNDVHVFLTSHLLYEGSRIITFSNKSPLSIIYKEIGTMNVRLEQNEPVALEQ